MLAHRTFASAPPSARRNSRRSASGTLRRLGFATLVALGAPAAALAAVATTGTLKDGTAFRIDYPDQFNGTLLVGLDYASGNPNSAQNQALLARGYALAGTTRFVTGGWNTQGAIENQVEVVEKFKAIHGKPARAVQFGSSAGGHVGAATVQARPDVFAGAVLMCGGLSGTVGQWHAKLDAVYVAKMLIAPNDPRLPVINIPDDFATNARPAWLQTLANAQQTPEGRARIALAAVLGQLPTWSNPAKPKPAEWDLAGLQDGLYDSLAGGPLPTIGQAMSSRNEIEMRSGGNISSNVGVDYADLLERVRGSEIVRQLYREANLDLNADLETLARSPRYKADPKALVWAEPGIFTGKLKVPVLTVNNIGDNISTTASQSAFQDAVDRAGASEMLRQLYVESAGHCGFSAAETVAAVETLQHRLLTKKWDDADNPHKLNALARSLNLGAARFISYTPDYFARPFTECHLKQAKKEAKLPEPAKPGPKGPPPHAHDHGPQPPHGPGPHPHDHC
jgi:pimeloyl-ACP methyl ester carboxylesterase